MQNRMPPFPGTNPKNPHMKSRFAFRLLLLPSAFLVAVSSPIASAGVFYWDTDDTTPGFGDTAGTWGSSAFWSVDPAGTASASNTTITSADTVNFGTATLGLGSTASTIGIDAGGVTTNGIVFGAGQTSPVTLSGGGGSITLAGATPTITVNNASNTIGAVLAGSAGLLKAGTGSLTLNGSSVNNFTGGLNISRGTLALDFANLGATNNLINSGNSLTLGGSGTLSVAGNATNNSSQSFATTNLAAGGRNTISLAKGSTATSATLNLGTLTANPGSITTIITGTAGGTTWVTGVTPTADIIKVSGITGKTLPVASGSTNWINVNAGLFYRQSASNGTARWVSVDNTGQLGALPAGITAIAAGTNDARLAFQLANNTNIVLTASTNPIIYGLVPNAAANPSTLTTPNSGTLTLNGILQVNTGLTTINAGTGTSNLVIGSERNLVINMDNSGGVTINAPIANNGAGASDVTIASTMPSGTPGNVTFGGTNTFTGQLRVLNGTLQVATANNVSANGTLGNSASSVILGSTGLTGTLRYTGATASSSKPFTMAADGTGAIDVTTTANTLTLSGSINGGGNLNKGGGGTLTLSGNNSHAGTTTVSAGTLVANHNSALGSTAGATTVASGTGLVLGNGITITGETVTISGTGNSFDGALRTATAANAEWAGAVILGDANARIGAAATTTLTVSGAIQNGVGTNLNLTGASGTGTILLSAAAGSNTYSGATNIIRGTLKIGATNSLPTGTALDVDSSTAAEVSTFDLNGFDQTVGALQRSGAGGGAGGSFVTNSAVGINTLAVNQAVDTTYSGVIQGNLALTKGGAGSLTLTGANTYGGATTISGGTLQLGDGTTDGTISGTSGVTNDGTLVFNRVGNHTAAFGIAGTGAVIKTGAGTQILTAANGYTGATLVSGGTLALSGSGAVNFSSGITIDGGGAKLLHVGGTAISTSVTLTNGTLTGSGTVNAVTVGAGTGGVISNNDGVAGAALTIGTLTLNGAANLNLFSDTTTAPLIVTGTLTTGATAATLTANNPGGWDTGSTYTILTFGNNAIAGGGDNFTKVTNNLTARQSGAWNATTSAITLAISGDAPKWTGALNNEWSTDTLGAPKNWVLQTAATATDFLNTDDVLFDDTASTFTPDISAADVSPFATTFNNSTKNYTLGGGFGIATGTLTKSGTGTLTITNANTYTGATVINGGTLQLGDGTSGKDGSIANTSGVTNDGSLVFNRFGTTTAGYAIGGSGAVTVTGTGTQTLTGANTSSGLTTINSGATLQLGDATFGKDGTIANTSGVTNDGTLVFNRFGSSSAGYVIGGTGAVTVTGAGTQTLTGANTYGGLTTINSGATLQLGDGTSGNDGTIANTSGVTNNGKLVFNRFGNSTAGYVIGGTGAVTKTGAGTQTLSGLSTTAAINYSGTTTIDGGTLAFTTTNPSLTGGLTFGASAGSANNGGLDLSAASATFGGGLIVRTNSVGNNVITIGSGRTLTFTDSTVTNAISVGSATAGGVAKLQVTGGGTFTVDDSTRNIVVANTDTSGTGASAQMDLSGLTNFNANVANIYVGRPTSVAGAAANGKPNDSLKLAVNNDITVSGVIGVGGTSQSPNAGTTQQFLLGQANTIKAGSILVGSSRIPANFAYNTGLTDPTVTLRGAAGGVDRTNIYLGDQGNTQAVSNGAGGSTPISGRMDFTGGSVDAMVDSLFVGLGAGTASNLRGEGNGIFIVDGASSTVDINSLVIGQTTNSTAAATSEPNATVSTGTVTLKNGALTVNTAATLANDIDASNTTNGNQSAVGNLNIEGGTATIGSIGSPVNLTLGNKIASGNAGTATAAVNLSGGTLNMFGNIQEGTQGNGTITSSLTLGGGTLDMKGNSIGASGAPIDTLTFASGTLQNVAQINNGGAITKSGTGTLTLAGTNNYTGATLASAGTLFVTGSIASDVTVSDNATLGGGGTTGEITLGGGSFFDIALALFSNPLDSTAISFGDPGIGNPRFGIDNLVSNGAEVNWGTVFDGTYTLINGTLDSTNLDNFGVGNAFDLGGGRSAYFQSGSLQLVVIPEPSAALLGALGAMLLLRRRR